MRLPRATTLALAAALAHVVAACAGAEGTIEIEVVAAPGSDLLERIQRARLTLSNPSEVVEAERDENGHLSLSLDVVAEGQSGTARLEGFDAGGALIALGLSPALPVAAVDARITMYLAPPFSFAEAPVALEPARGAVGGALLPYGALLAGGFGADRQAVSSLVIYNVYDHSLQIGLDLPQPRGNMTVVSGPSDFVYLFGGTPALVDEGRDLKADAWRFDTSVSPTGLYATLITDDALAREGAAAAYAGNETFFVAGDPPARIDAMRVEAIEEAVPCNGAAVATIPSLTGAVSVLVVGAEVGTTGAALYQSGAMREIPGPEELARGGHALVPLPDGRLLTLGGVDSMAVKASSGVIYDPTTAAFTVVDDLLQTPRSEAAIAVTSDVVVVAGGLGEDGSARTDAEILDAHDLRSLGTIPLGSERIGGLALPLPNRQILLASGATGDGTPVPILELFTPAE